MSFIYDVEISMCRSSAGPYQSAKSVQFRMAFHEVLHEYRRDKSMFLACIASSMVSTFSFLLLSGWAYLAWRIQRVITAAPTLGCNGHDDESM